ncbi:MAG: serine/threonine-protein kinase [Candidatus Bipolaricaulota bacterium]
MSSIQCPFCREDIRDGAIKCKHCGSLLDPGAAVAPTMVAPRGYSTSAGQNQDLLQDASAGATAWWNLSGPLAPGTVVREYRVVRMLGQGGMGEVYLGIHTLTDQSVALKVVSPELMRDDGTRRRFLEEARVMAEMQHPNIVQLLAFFEEGNRFFLVMEYVDGDTIEGILNQRMLTLEEALRFSRGILAGLQYAHTRPNPVIHRDMKPPNILVGTDGRPVITDFGVAKAVGRERMTRTRGVVGTYEYMSPEQARGDEVTPASDVYSFGIMLYKMLTGVVPFPQKSETGLECMTGHVQGSVLPLREFREGLPSWLQGVMDRLLAKDPQQRFPSADEVARELAAHTGESAAPTPVPETTGATGSQRGTKRSASPAPQSAEDRGRSSAWVVALVVALVAAGVGGVLIWQNVGAKNAPGAEREVAERILTPSPDAENDPSGDKAPVPPDPEAKANALCEAQCGGKLCGDDECGGSCGTCPSDRMCSEGACVCSFRECQGACCAREEICGPDGTCCAPSCANHDCGSDGCGGSCGSCSGGRICKGFRCVVPRLERLAPEMSASSWNYKASNPDRYNPANLLDGSGETAWCKDNGVGEWILLTLPEPGYLFRLRVRNGFQKAASSGLGDPFSINSRVRSMKLVFSDGTARVASLQDERSWQEIDLGGVHSTSLKIVIESAFNGRDKSICISDVILEGDL